MTEFTYWLDQTMTRDEAIKFIKQQRGKGMALFISCGQQAPIAGVEGRVFPIVGNIPVTMPAAIMFLGNAYSDVLCGRGAVVKMRGLGKCIFIGEAA